MLAAKRQAVYDRYLKYWAKKVCCSLTQLAFTELGLGVPATV